MAHNFISNMSKICPFTPFALTSQWTYLIPIIHINADDHWSCAYTVVLTLHLWIFQRIKYGKIVFHGLTSLPSSPWKYCDIERTLWLQIFFHTNLHLRDSFRKIECVSWRLALRLLSLDTYIANTHPGAARYYGHGRVKCCICQETLIRGSSVNCSTLPLSLIQER